MASAKPPPTASTVSGRGESSEPARGKKKPPNSQDLGGKLWGSRENAPVSWERGAERDKERFAKYASRPGEDPFEGGPAGTNKFRPQKELEVPRAPPGTVDPEKCTAEGAGLEKAILRVPGRFTITARDAAGKAIVPSEAEKFTIDIIGLEKPPYSVVEMEDGRLAIRWVPTVAGDFRVNLRCNGLPIAGSPFDAVGAAGEIDPAQCTVKDVPKSVQAGEPARFIIEARDQMANLANYPPLDRLVYTFLVEVVGPADVIADVYELSEGLQPVSLPLEIVGEYTIRVRGANGQDIDGGVHSITVRPTPLEAKFCKATGTALKSAVAGEMHSFGIAAHDPYGNLCEAKEELHARDNCAFTVTLEAASALKDFGDASIAAANKKRDAEMGKLAGYVKALTRGTFTAEYLLARAGRYRISHDLPRPPTTSHDLTRPHTTSHDLP